MAELTHLDEKLAEVLGLAQAAQQAADKVAGLAEAEDESELVKVMQEMGQQAAEVQTHCEKVAATRDGMKTAIDTKARETKAEVVDFMKTYLEDAEALDGLEFLSMAVAGELAHWEILDTLNKTAKDSDVTGVVEFALPIQRNNVGQVRDHYLRLAADEDPPETA